MALVDWKDTLLRLYTTSTIAGQMIRITQYAFVAIPLVVIEAGRGPDWCLDQCSDVSWRDYLKGVFEKYVGLRYPFVPFSSVLGPSLVFLGMLLCFRYVFDLGYVDYLWQWDTRLATPTSTGMYSIDEPVYMIDYPGLVESRWLYYLYLYQLSPLVLEPLVYLWYYFEIEI